MLHLKKNTKRFVVVGDIHGLLDSFVAILRHAGLVDNHLNWCGGQHRLLQMGDVFDRGPQSKEVDALLDTLQEQALKAGGEVIRLVGNHELEMLLSNFSISALERESAQATRDKLTNQVLQGALRAAYAYKGFLFTHAGVTRKLYRIFKLQLEDASAYNLATLINLIFRESIRHQFFKHPIFNISISRMGTDHFGGIFWEDLLDLCASFPRSPVWQVVGHTQVEQITIDKRAQLIAVDVGLHRRKQYLEIDTDGTPSVREVK